MTRRARKRELMALGAPLYTPTEEQRRQVRMYLFNAVSEKRIAEILDISLDELRYHFRKELNIGTDELMAWSASNIVALAGQREDLGVALKANTLMLQSRKKVWRIPTSEVDEDTLKKPVDRLSLAETEAEIARILERRGGAGGASADPAPTQSSSDEGEDEP